MLLKNNVSEIIFEIKSFSSLFVTNIRKYKNSNNTQHSHKLPWSQTRISCVVCVLNSYIVQPQHQESCKNAATKAKTTCEKARTLKCIVNYIIICFSVCCYFENFLFGHWFVWQVILGDSPDFLWQIITKPVGWKDSVCPEEAFKLCKSLYFIIKWIMI